MKKALCILLISAIVFTMSGCKDGGRDKNTQQNEQQTQQHERPSSAARPNTVNIDDMFGYLNDILGSSIIYEYDRDDADIFDLSATGHDQGMLYMFDHPGHEAVITTDAETDNFLHCYFRLTVHSEDIFAAVVTIAAAFLEILEPDEYQRMIYDVMQSSGLGGETHSEAKAVGEIWMIMFNDEDLINILPA